MKKVVSAWYLVLGAWCLVQVSINGGWNFGYSKLAFARMGAGQ